VFGNRVLRSIFRHRSDEVTRGWRKLHKKIHNLYTSPNIIRMINSNRIRQAGQASCMGTVRNGYNILVEVKKPTRCRLRWGDNIKIHLRATGWEGELDSSGLGYRLAAGSCKHSNERLSSVNGNRLTS
jgi:hypothetical protein